MSDKSNGLTENEALELQKVRIRQEMQEEILSWAKKRFTMLGVLAAVLGFFGLSTVLNQSLQALVHDPVKRQLEKLDTARERARDVIFELTQISEDVKKQGASAQEAAERATQKIEELQSKIKSASTTAQDIITRYDSVNEGIDRVSHSIFGVASALAEEEAILKLEINKTSEKLKAMEELNTAIAETFRTTTIAGELDRFRERMDRIETNHIASLDLIELIKTFNVVYYIRREEDFNKAQSIVNELRTAGFRAAVWYPSAYDRNAVIDEIAAEFGPVSDVLSANAEGIVIHPQHQKLAETVKGLVAGKYGSRSPETFLKTLEPVEKHLIREPGGEPFESDRVILIYSLGPVDDT